jgi:regulator of protease activity HflC (stomatin/prohibitin superfamily)
MTTLTRQRARSVARSDAEAAAKIIAVQEAQIAALKAEAAAYAAVLVGVCELYGLWDFVDPATGEVTSGKSKRPSQ